MREVFNDSRSFTLVSGPYGSPVRVLGRARVRVPCDTYKLTDAPPVTPNPPQLAEVHLVDAAPAKLTLCPLVTALQTCALPISRFHGEKRHVRCVSTDVTDAPPE